MLRHVQLIEKKDFEGIEPATKQPPPYLSRSRSTTARDPYTIRSYRPDSRIGHVEVGPLLSGWSHRLSAVRPYVCPDYAQASPAIGVGSVRMSEVAFG